MLRSFSPKSIKYDHSMFVLELLLSTCFCFVKDYWGQLIDSVCGYFQNMVDLVNSHCLLHYHQALTPQHLDAVNFWNMIDWWGELQNYYLIWNHAHSLKQLYYDLMGCLDRGFDALLCSFFLHVLILSSPLASIIIIFYCFNNQPNISQQQSHWSLQYSLTLKYFEHIFHSI